MSAQQEVAERPIIFTAESVRAILEGRKSQTRRVVAPDNSEFGSAPRTFWRHGDFDGAFVDGKGSGSEYLHVPVHNVPECAECREWGWVGSSHRLYPRIAPARCWDQEPNKSEDYTPPASRLWVREGWRWFGRIRNAGEVEGGFEYREGATQRRFEDFPDPDAAFDVFRAAAVEERYQWRSPIHMPRWASRLTLEITGVRVERLQEISYIDVIEEGCPPEEQQLASPEDFTWYRNAWNRVNEKRGYGWDKNPWVWVIEFRKVQSLEASTNA